MTYEDLLWFLRTPPALIVHFSHYAKMRNGGVYPNDLLGVIANSRTWSLSCCLITPAHTMALPGTIGLVLRPRSLSSIVSVRNIDSGTMSLGGDQEGSLGEPLTAETARGSLDVPAGEYNEWRVRDSEVVGVYYEAPLAAKRRVCLESEGVFLGEDIASSPVAMGEVHETFVDLPVLTRSSDQTRFVASHVPVSTLYR